MLAGLVGLLILGALFGEDDKPSDDQPGSATTTTSPGPTTSSPTSTATTPAEAEQTLQDARDAVDGDDYTTAVAIATALGAGPANAIRRRIANRLAVRVLAAVRAGDRSRASSLLRQASRYPTTQQLRQARTSYKAAKARASQRAQARRDAATQRRRDAAARRAAEEQAEQAPPAAPAVPAGRCSDIPQTDFPVGPGDPRDRDGDGIACES